MSINITPDRRYIPAAIDCRRFAVISLIAPDCLDTNRPNVAIGMAVDRSTSMTGEKLATAKRALVSTLQHLQHGDTIAITAFGDDAEVFLPATMVDRTVGARISDALASLDVQGSTNLSAGWFLACREISTKASQQTVARCILLTDGNANKGIIDRQELLMHARELRRRHITTSAFGIGADFDQETLSAIVDEGGGSFAYIETAQQILQALQLEMAAAQRITAKSVQISLKADPGLSIHVHGGFPITEDNGTIILKIPDLCDGQTFDLSLSLDIAASTANPTLRLIAELQWTLADGTTAQHGEILEWHRAATPQVDEEPVDTNVLDRVAAMACDEAVLSALKANAEGKYPAARSIMEQTLRRLRELPVQTATIVSHIVRIQKSMEELARPMDNRTSHKKWGDSYTRTRQTTLGMNVVRGKRPPTT